MINFHEYNALRAYTHREKRMIEAYYKKQNSTSFWILDPSLIVASLFHSHFEYEYKEPDYGASIMKFQIHEAMALSNALSTLGEPIFENLHARLSSEIAKWKPSLTALTLRIGTITTSMAISTNLESLTNSMKYTWMFSNNHLSKKILRTIYNLNTL
jgi:hypothetical protein